MHTDPVTALFEEFRSRFGLGEQPEVSEFLERAGADADELEELIEGYLLSAPLPEPSDAAVAQMQAWLDGKAPLVEARATRGLSRDRLVAALVERLGLATTSAPKVGHYLHELESGLLDPRRVSRRALAVVAEMLDVCPGELLAWPQRGLGASAFARLSEAPQRPAGAPPQPPAAAAPLPAAALAPPPGPAEWDEVDRLFLGGPDT